MELRRHGDIGRSGLALAAILSAILIASCERRPDRSGSNGSGGPVGVASTPSSPAAATPLRARLLSLDDFLSADRNPDLLRRGAFDAVAVVVDEESPAARIEEAARAAAAQGSRFFLWFDVGRNRKLADRHPGWIAGIGAHEDWRSLFPAAPRPKDGERVGVYPWVSIWYREVLEDRRAAIRSLVAPHLKGIAGVFLNQIQGAPSACGCGNLQCRWTVDYRMAGGPERIEGSPATLLIQGLKRDLPGVEWIPVLVTECEQADLAKDGTGYCGTVPCYDGLCWKEFTREMEPLSAEVKGPLGLLAAKKLYRRDLPRYGGEGAWPGEAARLLSAMFERNGRAPIPPARLWAIVEGDGADPAQETAIAESTLALGVMGVVVSRVAIDESWEPRIISFAPKKI